jgi:hypothetical protein
LYLDEDMVKYAIHGYFPSMKSTQNVCLDVFVREDGNGNKMFS